MTTIYGGDPIRLDSGKAPVVRFALTDGAKAVGLPYPERKHDSDAGFDLRAFSIEFAMATDDTRQTLRARFMINTGVQVSIPPGYCGLIRERSSWASAGLRIVGGVIDSGYIGPVTVICYGFKEAVDTLNISESHPRFAQLLIVPVWTGGVEYVESLDETERGAGGFGSTFHD